MFEIAKYLLDLIDITKNQDDFTYENRWCCKSKFRTDLATQIDAYFHAYLLWFRLNKRICDIHSIHGELKKSRMRFYLLKIYNRRYWQLNSESNICKIRDGSRLNQKPFDRINLCVEELKGCTLWNSKGLYDIMCFNRWTCREVWRIKKIIEISLVTLQKSKVIHSIDRILYAWKIKIK